MSPDKPSTSSVPRLNAAALLREPTSWVGPAVLTAVLMTLLSLIYMGGIVNPTANMENLPVAVVNEDRATLIAGQRRELGQSMVDGLTQSSELNGRLSLRKMSRPRAEHDLDAGKLYAMVVFPADFTATTVALASPAPATSPARPTIQVFTNQRAGSLAVSLATGVLQQALAKAAHQLGQTLTQQVSASGTKLGTAASVLLADPVAISVTSYRPLPANAGLGLTAFYYVLLAVLIGFLGATVVSSAIDGRLGFATSDVGAKLTLQLPTRISRTHTLLTKWMVSAILAPLASALLLASSAGILDMDAPHAFQLWAFIACAIIAVSAGAHALLAAFGSLGHLLAMFFFIVLALPSSGATVPLEAVPGFYRLAALFEPMTQLVAGVRAILYFDARVDAGLDRGWFMIGGTLVLSLIFGLAVTRFYDRRGLDRIPSGLLNALHAVGLSREGAHVLAPLKTGTSDPR